MNADAERFLHALGGRLTFQTFAEGTSKGKPGLSRILHGTLVEHADTLARLNARGAGVFVTVNEGDGKQRNNDCVQRIRAYFADFDTVQPPDVVSVPLAPHAIIESSPGRWHWYWWIDSAPLHTFKAVQVAIAERFGSDAKVCDLARVMRLPGFDHHKREPYRTRIESLRAAPRFTHAEFVQAFGIDLNATQTHGKRNARADVARLLVKRRTLPDVIPEGERNATLLSLAAGLVNKGHDLRAVTDRLQKMNAEKCETPLCAREVDTIAARAIGYGSDGFAILPHRLLDSPEWKALPPAAHDVILTAFRRYDGTNGRNIALTWEDFDGLPGLARKQTFYRHRRRVLASGILLQISEGGNSQRGKKPDLFAIAERWLHSPPVSILKPCASVENVYPYIDKQSLDACDLALPAGDLDSEKAA
jgi:hypothetical protein